MEQWFCSRAGKADGINPGLVAHRRLPEVASRPAPLQKLPSKPSTAHIGTKGCWKNSTKHQPSTRAGAGDERPERSAGLTLCVCCGESTAPGSAAGVNLAGTVKALGGGSLWNEDSKDSLSGSAAIDEG